MDAAAAPGRGRGRIAAARRLSELAEPGPDRCERAHEAARPQQLAPRPPACAQKAIEPLLLDLVHVQQSVCRPFIECAGLDVLAEHPGALLVAAAEQTAAVVIVRRRVALASRIMLMRHSQSRILNPWPHSANDRKKPAILPMAKAAIYDQKLDWESRSLHLQQISSEISPIGCSGASFRIQVDWESYNAKWAILRTTQIKKAKPHAQHPS